MADKKSNKGLAFIFGAAVGAAAGYLFTTDEGKKLRKQAAEKAGELKEVAKQQLDEMDMDAMLEKGKVVLKDGLDQVTNGTKTTVDRVESSFQRGMNKAKIEMDRQRSNVDDYMHNGRS